MAVWEVVGRELRARRTGLPYYPDSGLKQLLDRSTGEWTTTLDTGFTPYPLLLHYLNYKGHCMRTYYLFGGDTYYPLGGWEDFKGAFPTEADCIEVAAEWGYDWWQIVSVEKMTIINKGEQKQCPK